MADIAHRTADVAGFTMFYRDAGAADAPTPVLPLSSVSAALEINLLLRAVPAAAT